MEQENQVKDITTRNQKVQFRNNLSSNLSVNVGVPQYVSGQKSCRLSIWIFHTYLDISHLFGYTYISPLKNNWIIIWCQNERRPSNVLVGTIMVATQIYVLSILLFSCLSCCSGINPFHGRLQPSNLGYFFIRAQRLVLEVERILHNRGPSVMET